MADAPNPGQGVDAAGNPVIDPTANVIAKVEDAVKRLDDLRIAAEKLSNVEHGHMREIGQIRADHARDLNEAETKRIDAIRAVDVAAVAIATERAGSAANVLATQVIQTAETLRALVASTAAASQTQATASFNQLSDRIGLLERSNYEGSGRSAVADPQLAKMVETMDKLSLAMAEGLGGRAKTVDNRSNIQVIVAIIVVGLALYAALNGAG